MQLGLPVLDGTGTSPLALDSAGGAKPLVAPDDVARYAPPVPGDGGWGVAGYVAPAGGVRFVLLVPGRTARWCSRRWLLEWV